MAWCNKPDPNLNLPCQAVIDLISGFIETFSFPRGKDKRRWCKEQTKRTVSFSFSFLHFKASKYLIWIIYLGMWWRAGQKGIDWTDLGLASWLNAILCRADASVGGLAISESIVKKKAKKKKHQSISM